MACKGSSSYPSISDGFVIQETLVSLLRLQLEVPAELWLAEMDENAGSFPPPAMLDSKTFLVNSRFKEQIFKKFSYFCDTNSFFKTVFDVCYKKTEKHQTATGKFALLPSTPQQRRMIGSKELVRIQKDCQRLLRPSKGMETKHCYCEMHAKNKHT